MQNFVNYENIKTIISEVKTWVLSLLEKKQDKLTAGSHITIDADNTISATLESDDTIVLSVDPSDKYYWDNYLKRDVDINTLMPGYRLAVDKGTVVIPKAVETAAMISATRPIMRIGAKQVFLDEEDSMNGNRITIMGYFHIGMWGTAKKGAREEEGGVIQYYYGNLQYSTTPYEVSDGNLNNVDWPGWPYGTPPQYITENNDTFHFSELMCWKKCWYTKGYIK